MAPVAPLLAKSAQLARPRCWLQNLLLESQRTRLGNGGAQEKKKKELTSGPGLAAQIITQLAAKDTLWTRNLVDRKSGNSWVHHWLQSYEKKEVENVWHASRRKKKKSCNWLQSCTVIDWQLELLSC